MPLQLEIVSDHKDLLGDDCVRVFREEGGTIGRSLENDWILPDPDKFISGKHATIDFQTGAFYLADVSTNGVYVNDEDAPLGKGNPRRLFDGDRLRMGDFVFVVSLDEGEGLEMPPPEPMTVVPDHIEQLVPEVSLKSGIQLLDEEEITGDSEFQSALFGGPSKKDEAAKKSAREKINSQENPFAPPPTKDQQAMMQAAELLDAFMTGLDISRAEIHPSTDPLEVMHNAGRVLKEFVDGTTDLLASRTALKSMFRLDQTTVLPRHNNPLKLAENTRDSMMQLLVGKEGEYLGPVDAVREVCRDLKYHQDAVLEAMISAFVEFADKFDPVELQQNFDRTLNNKPLLKAINQVKYWQLYCDLYPIMTQSSSGKFPHQFSEEFVRSYEKNIADFKRLERHGDVKPKKRDGQDEPQVTFDQEELIDQTEEASYADQF
jgi:type VI secretion system FHA domain protein